MIMKAKAATPRRFNGEKIITAIIRVAGYLSVLYISLIFLFLLKEGLPALGDVPLKDLFGKSGSVVAVRLIENKFSGKSKGYAFLEMGTPEQAQAAIRSVNGKEFKGRKIVVSEAKSKSRA